uniref:Uncharacterized protein n=1 Tax=Anguilla anguilla TaxID=7936 RepID=A0A0E9UDG7_ANGAN
MQQICSFLCLSDPLRGNAFSDNCTSEANSHSSPKC